MPTRLYVRSLIVIAPLVALACSSASPTGPDAPIRNAGAEPAGGSSVGAKQEGSKDVAIDGGQGSTTLALDDSTTATAPTKLEPLPSAVEATPDAGHPKTPPRHSAGRTPADIQKAVLSLRDQARACYDEGSKDHPGVEGDLVMKFTIDPKGAVGAIEADPVRSAISEPTIITCVGNVLKQLSFPASPGHLETHTSYPFTFHAHRHPAP